MAEKDYESSKVILENLKDRNSDQQISNCFPFWQKKKDHRYSQISGHQISIDIWSTDTHKYLVDRYTWIPGPQIPGIQKQMSNMYGYMGRRKRCSSQPMTSNQIKSPYSHIAIWTYTWDCETNDFSATGKRSPGPCFKTVFEDFNFSQNRLTSKLVSFILTFQDAPDSAKNRPIDLQKLGNRPRKWTFELKEQKHFSATGNRSLRPCFKTVFAYLNVSQNRQFCDGFLSY